MNLNNIILFTFTNQFMECSFQVLVKFVYSALHLTAYRISA